MLLDAVWLPSVHTLSYLREFSNCIRQSFRPLGYRLLVYALSVGCLCSGLRNSTELKEPFRIRAQYHGINHWQWLQWLTYVIS